MAFWHRIGKPKLFIQFHRCFIHLPHASSFNSAPKPSPFDIPHLFDRPTTVFNSVRFFAAPVQFQVKTKKEEEDTSGRRLNEQIKASYVRLVIGDEHSIVSRFEALERAKKLKLDLVEVQRNAKPPVCKIMDFHKEMYKQQEREKERAKSKAEVTLRKECKEVRFSEKTEAKDLKTKADMVTKLMEKGYRVKCKISGKEDQDATELLSPLLALIEDVCVVESGPHMSKKDAFMIVRHVKYGLSKKGGKKSQDAAHVMPQEGNVETADSSDSIEMEEEVLSDGAWSVFSHNVNVTASPDSQTNAALEVASLAVSEENRYKRTDNRGEDRAQSNAQVPPAATENRYRRVEPRNRFQQTTSNNTAPNNRVPGMRDTDRSTPPNWNRPRHGPVNFKPQIEQNKQAFGPGSRHSMPSRENIPKHHPNAPPRPGYGNFRSPNEDTPKHPSAPIPNTPRHTSYGIFSTPKGP